MGMRIRKSLCYFAENIEFDSQVLSDFIDNTTPEALIEKFMAIYNPEEDTDLALAITLLKRQNSLRDDIVLDEEYLGEKMIGFIPFGFSDNWTRHGDDIDYEEYYLKHPDHGAGIDITYLKKSLYPFEGYVDKFTGRRIARRNNVIDVCKYIEKPEDVLEYVKKQTGYDSLEDLKNNTCPFVPISIKLLIEYSGAFKNPEETYLKLRPAIVQWWS